LTYGGKRIGVTLTDHGDTVIRGLVGGDTARGSFPLLAAVESVKAAFGGGSNAGFILETDILGKDYDAIASADLVSLENRALPLLCRGWLESFCDIEGRCGYRVSAAGAVAIRPKSGRLPAYDDAAADEYDRLFRDALAERNNWQPSTPSQVAIPLSAGRWPEKPEPNPA
jgi:hypothetical protein